MFELVNVLGKFLRQNTYSSVGLLYHLLQHHNARPCIPLYSTENSVIRLSSHAVINQKNMIVAGMMFKAEFPE